MFGHIFLELLQKLIINSHFFLNFQNLCLFSLIIHRYNTTKFQPSKVMFWIPKFPDNNVNWVSIVRKQHIVRDTEFNQLIGNQTEDERQRIGCLRNLIVLSQGRKNKSVTQLWIDLRDLYTDVVKINFLWWVD